MLDCCRPLNDIAQVGLTLSEFACLARCNGLRAQVVSPLVDWSPQERAKGLERFRNDLRAVSRGDGTMALSYSRKTLGQTGDGHFSPIGALCEEKDMVLILDVARFKYAVYNALSSKSQGADTHLCVPADTRPIGSPSRSRTSRCFRSTRRPVNREVMSSCGQPAASPVRLTLLRL